MKKYTKKELAKILELHGKWLRGEADGVRAILRGANLQRANLRKAYLQRADLQIADLRGANLLWADLQGAILQGANLQRAILRGADLQRADLSHTVIKTFTLGKHFGYVWVNSDQKQIVKIGCEEHEMSHWKKNIVEIGKKNGYSYEEIKLYSAQLKILRMHFKTE